MSVAESYINGHASELSGLFGELPPVKSKDLLKAELIIDQLLQDKIQLQEEVNLSSDLNFKLKGEVAKLKVQLADASENNAKTQREDSAAVIDGMEAQRKLDDIKTVLPVDAKDLSKKSIWKSLNLLTAPFRKEIKELENKISHLEKQQGTYTIDSKPKDPWWSWLPF